MWEPEEQDMRAPTIHLNGTSKAALLQEYETAVRAVDAAEKAVAAVTVHGRDYYMQDDTVPMAAYQEARAQHENLLQRLRDVSTALQATYEAIYSQG